MKAYIKERTIEEANYIAETGDTVRKTAHVFHLSKSTVHADMAKRLQKLDENLFERVKIIMENNFAEKHIRGGASTKAKYEKIK